MKQTWSLILLVLALTGCDAMTAHTDTVARVGSHELTQEEMVELLAGNPGVPAQANVVESVANLWVDYTALTTVLSEDSTLAGIEMEELIQPYLEQRTFGELRGQLVTTDTVIDEDELRTAFEEQAPGLRIRARHVLLTYPEGAEDEARDSVRALADELQERAASGADFAALATEYSQDPGSAQSGGDLGWFERGRMVRPFEEAAFALEPGEVSEVVETPFGLHIIKLEERQAPDWDEQSSEQLRQQLVSQRRQASLTEYVDSLREAAGAEVQPGAADAARELADDVGKTLSSRAASRELVSWEGDALTAGEFVRALRRLPMQQQSQFATAPDEQLETVLMDLATNQLVLSDASDRGIAVPQEEQDSVLDLMVEQLNEVSRSVGLVGEPQSDETEGAAVDRRVRSFIESVLAGQQQVLPLGQLSYILRDQVEWQINESAFPAVVEELQERRATQQGPPGPPAGMQQPQGGMQQPQGQPLEPGSADTLPQGQQAPMPEPDTAG